MPSNPVEELREGSRASWVSPLSGVEYCFRRLSKADLVGCPEALPIFDLAAGMALAEISKSEKETALDREIAKRQLARHEEQLDEMDDHEAKITRHLICAAMISPRVLPDPEDYSEDPPDGALFYYQVPEPDRFKLLGRIRTLMAGLDAIERRLAAVRAVSFRGEPDISPDQEAGEAIGSAQPGAPDPIPSS